MTRARWQAAGALASGLLFGVGLLLSGMTRPEKVIGFLDLGGAWDPSLALVMVGAIGVHAVALRLLARRNAPLVAASFSLPPRHGVDTKLLTGAAIFGVGWGLGGYCPGPSIVSLAVGGGPVLAFVSALLGGSLLVTLLEELPALGTARPKGGEGQLTGPLGP